MTDNADKIRPLRPTEHALLLEEASYQGRVHAYAIKGGSDVSYEECLPHLPGLRGAIQRRVVAVHERHSGRLASEDVMALHRVAEAAFVARMTGFD